MYYHEFKAPVLIKSGTGILNHLDALLKNAHLYFQDKILITQEYLYNIYQQELNKNNFADIIFIEGGKTSEAPSVTSRIKDTDAIIFAFGGGSVLDIVKYCASKCDTPYITIPSTLSNDAVYSCVARLTTPGGKKRSYGVQPPIGIIVDLDVIRKSPRELILAGVADLVSNLSALKDWELAHSDIGEPINELAYMLSKEAVMPLFSYYNKEDVLSDAFLLDLTNGLITSGLSMIIQGDTRVSSGAEHLISHAIDEYFPEKATIHGLQVGWAHLIIERKYRKNQKTARLLDDFFNRIGLKETIDKHIPWEESNFPDLIPFAMKIRNRYTIFNRYIHNL